MYVVCLFGTAPEIGLKGGAGRRLTDRSKLSTVQERAQLSTQQPKMPSPTLLIKSIEDFASNNGLTNDMKELVSTCSAGFVGFTSGLAVSTCTQRYVGISTGSLRPVPSLFGLLSVCMAATISHQLASSAQHYYHTHKWHKRNNNLLQGFQFPVKDSSKTIFRLGSVPITMQTLKVYVYHDE